MTKQRLDGLYLLLLGAAVCILLGSVLLTIAPAKMSDFKAIYYGARCLIHHADPYQSSQILREFDANGEQFPTDPAIARPYRRAILTCINLPTTLLLAAPFASLPLGTALLLWTVLMLGGLLLAAYLMWDLGATFAPVLAGAMAGCIIANTEGLLINGNISGVAIALGLTALWCFIKSRFTGVGVFCLAVGLVFKPHALGFIWLYLFLAGGILRRRAIQALAITLAICIPAVVWMSYIDPNWMAGLHSNMLMSFARGDLNDPGPSSMGAHTLGMMVNLQTVVSVFRDDPNFYNPVTYLIVGPLIVIWALVTLRSRFSTDRMWIALAAISALSLLPVYHRIYDAKLLLLSIPACAMLGAEGGLIGWLSIGITTLAIVITSDLPWVAFAMLLSRLRPAMPWLSGSALNAMIAFPAPTMLLVMSIFYLWVYARYRTRPSQLLAERRPSLREETV